jgi:hypothetical protein
MTHKTGVKKQTPAKHASPSERTVSVPMQYIAASDVYVVYGTDFVVSTEQLVQLRDEELISTSPPPNRANTVTDELRSAWQIVDREVREVFGAGAKAELLANDGEDSSEIPFVLEAHYGLAGEPTDADWEGHVRILREYVRHVPADVRRQIRLVRTTR